MPDISVLNLDGTARDIKDAAARSSLANKQNKATIYPITLQSAQTSVTFSNVTTTTNSMIQVGTSVAGLDYNSISVDGSSYTVTFDAQSSDITVYLIVTEVA